MPKRPEQHETDDAGQDQLRAALRPIACVLNPIPKDYGRDFNAEVFADGKTTGITFEVQLKSSRSTAYSAGGDFVSQGISVAHGRYFCSELRTPIILVHADVESGRTFWVAPQLEAELPSRLEGKATDSEIAVRIPTANSLPETGERLLIAVDEAGTRLAARALARAAQPQRVSAVEGRIDKEALLRDLDAARDQLRLAHAQECLQTGRFEDAGRAAAVIVRDEQSTVGARLGALLIQEKVETRKAIDVRLPDRDRFLISLRISEEMEALTVDGPAHLKLFAIMSRRAAELTLIAHKYAGLVMHWRAQQHGGVIFRVQAGFERTQVERRFATKYNQFVRLVRYSSRSRHRWVLPQAMADIIQSASIMTVTLHSEGRQAVARQLSASAAAICRLAASYAAEAGDEESMVLSAHMAILADRDSEELRKWAEGLFATVRTPGSRRNALELLDMGDRRRRGEVFPGDIRTTPTQIEQNIAAALGVTLDSRDGEGKE